MGPIRAWTGVILLLVSLLLAAPRSTLRHYRQLGYPLGLQWYSPNGIPLLNDHVWITGWGPICLTTHSTSETISLCLLLSLTSLLLVTSVKCLPTKSRTYRSSVSSSYSSALNDTIVLCDNQYSREGERRKEFTPSPIRQSSSKLYQFTAHSRISKSEPKDDFREDDLRFDENRSTDLDYNDREPSAEYVPGGYHPVHHGDLYASRYFVLRKLGWGHFSTVWLSWDLKEKKFVALKISKSASQYRETALDEIRLIQAAYDGDPKDARRNGIVQLYDHFLISGSNGQHVCMVLEVLGDNLLKLVIDSRYQGLPIRMVKSIIKQVLTSLSYLHEKCKIIHTDIKPENILLCVSHDWLVKLASEATKAYRLNGPLPHYLGGGRKKQKLNDGKISMIDVDLLFKICVRENSIKKEHKFKLSKFFSFSEKQLNKVEKSNKNIRKEETRNDRSEEEINVKIADLGNSCWIDQHFSESIQTRQYRSLEVIIGSGYSTGADIWSTACLAFELATGDYLFEPQASTDYSRDEDHLAHIIELLGPIPDHIIMSGHLSHHFFKESGELLHIENLKPWSLVEVLTEKYRWSKEEARLFASFLEPMLEFDPFDRVTARECLNHEWLRI
ncbi:hypothetical protein O3M35_003686 [Rhynocoris fuscipes]|uniref:non-specific serine/threonine protein kinase n=1 Tax=Rhynocoris fuscipes TaxID=488301 RepID=A0AAW1CKU3_9HEMI